MKHTALTVLVLFALLLPGCKKKKLKGNVILTIEYNGQRMKGADIYMKQGAGAPPGIPLSQYDNKVAADGLGQAVFADLPEDVYYFYATSVVSAITVTGEIVVDVVPKEQFNRYEKKIILKQ